MSDVWTTVDELIHDLGAIRSFVDQAESAADPSAAAGVAEVRGAMNQATDAITRIFDDSQDSVVEAAWQAIARAQDAVRAARSCVTAARAGRQDAETMGEHARAQGGRARAQAEQLTDQAERLRRRGGFVGSLPPRSDRGSRD